MDRWQWNFSVYAIIYLISLLIFYGLWIEEGHSAPPSFHSWSDISIFDDRGKEITLRAPATRVIALYGAFNEILAALGQEKRIVARTKADITPDSIKKLPVIGTHMRPNVELVLSLEPDLILQATGRRRALEPVRALERAGLKVAVFDMNSLEGLYSSIERIGVLLGCKEKALSVINRMKAQIQAIREKTLLNTERPKVFFEVRYPNLLGAGGKNIVNEIIELAGGENCFSTIEKKFVRPNLESIIRCSPDYYIIQKGPMNKDPGDPTRRPNFMLIKAVKEGHWVVVPEELYSRPTPRIVEAIAQLSSLLHKR